MKCHKAWRLINELLDGEIREKDRLRLEAHLKGCSACRQVYEELKAMKALVAPAEAVEPADSVWERVKNRLQAEVIPGLQEESARNAREKLAENRIPWFKQPSTAIRYAMATIVFVALVAAAFFLGRNFEKTARPQLQAAAGNPALQKIQEAEYYYKKAIESLFQAVRESENNLPPEMVEVWQANLNVLDRTIERCQQAVNDQPDNFQAREYLLSAYNSKLNFLNNMLETKKSLVAPGA